MNESTTTTDALVAESRRLRTEFEAAQAAMLATYDELAALLQPDQATMLRDFSDAMTNSHGCAEALRIANLARHLPHLYGVVRLLAEHVDIDTDCCTLDRGFTY